MRSRWLFWNPRAGLLAFSFLACRSTHQDASEVPRDRREGFPQAPEGILLGSSPYNIFLSVQQQRVGKVLRMRLPGLPFHHGRVELSIRRKTGDALEEGIFAEQIHYAPISDFADLHYLLPTLASGRYELVVKLFLQGETSSIAELQKPASIRSLDFIVSDSGPAPPSVRLATFKLDGYLLTSSDPPPEKVEELRAFLREFFDVEIVKIRVEGHSCDIGTPAAKWKTAQRRAEAIALVVKEALGRDVVIVSRSDDAVRDELRKRDLTGIERQGYRRVEVQVLYRMRGDAR